MNNLTQFEQDCNIDHDNQGQMKNISRLERVDDIKGNLDNIEICHRFHLQIM